jgi:hypothetical protein
MSLASIAEEESFSVAFEPRHTAQESLKFASNFSKHPIVKQILEKVGQPLLELGRRARRVGPVDAGTIVLLAGLQEGVGCSTAALACAAAASTECPTALVDVANSNSNSCLESRSLTQLLVGLATVGWEEVVAGVASIQDVVHLIDSRESLAFFPKSESQGSGFRAPDSGFSHAGMAGWLGRLRQKFGLVFLDGGSIESGASQWAPWVDTALILCDPRQSSDADRTRTWDRFEEGGAHVLGIVETFV